MGWSVSRAAETWFFDECRIRGNEGWVLVTLCNYADDDGIAGLSKKSLTAKTCMSEATVYRALQSLEAAGVLEPVKGEAGPEWWRDIPLNRRPRLVRLTAFLGSRFATPDGSGVSQGSQTGPSGVSQGYQATAADQHFRDVMVDGVTDSQSRARSEGKCGEWAAIDAAPIPGTRTPPPTVGPCILELDHDGPCRPNEPNPPVLVGRERKDTA